MWVRSMLGSWARRRPSRAIAAGLTCAVVGAALLVPAAGRSQDSNAAALKVAKVTITLRCSGPRYAGTFYSGFLPATDYAVWIESGSGAHVRTLAVTPSVVSVGAYSHVEHLPAWQASTGLSYADLEAETQEGIAPSFDGLTHASVLFADADVDTTLACEWDLTQEASPRPEDAQFRFCAEVANIAKSEATSYDVLAETTCGTLDLAAGQATAAAPTQHILGLSAALDFVPDGTAVEDLTWSRIKRQTQ